MFTGLVEAVGRVAFVRRTGEGMDLAVEAPDIAGEVAIGDSISLSGCCTTATQVRGKQIEFHMTRETLARTWFGRAEAGRQLNLERALAASARLGGHFVQGHVDGKGEILGWDRRQDGSDLRVRIPDDLHRYCVEKGSIAIDGVSLTIAAIAGGEITIALIPHTMQVTTLGRLQRGEDVHIEVDVLAKYVEKLLVSTS